MRWNWPNPATTRLFRPASQTKAKRRGWHGASRATPRLVLCRDRERRPRTSTHFKSLNRRDKPSRQLTLAEQHLHGPSAADDKWPAFLIRHARVRVDPQTMEDGRGEVGGANRIRRGVSRAAIGR